MTQELDKHDMYQQLVYSHKEECWMPVKDYIDFHGNSFTSSAYFPLSEFELILNSTFNEAQFHKTLEEQHKPNRNYEPNFRMVDRG